MDPKQKSPSTGDARRQPFNDKDAGMPGGNQGVTDNQLLNKKAEEYLRESGKIEDYPEADEQKKAEEKLRENE